MSTPIYITPEPDYWADPCVSSVGSDTPAAYRLAKKSGELVLQGMFVWTNISRRGVALSQGSEWRDLPTINLDAAPAAPVPTTKRAVE